MNEVPMFQVIAEGESDGVFVDIQQVFPETVRVAASEIVKGDHVFDAYGGTHEVRSTTIWKNHTTVRRYDGWASTWANDAEVTIKRVIQ